MVSWTCLTGAGLGATLLSVMQPGVQASHDSSRDDKHIEGRVEGAPAESSQKNYLRQSDVISTTATALCGGYSPPDSDRTLVGKVQM